MIEFVWKHKTKLSGGAGIAMLVVGGGLAAFGLLSSFNQQWEVPLSAAEFAPISAKLGGVLAMFGSIAMLFILPWLDNHPVRSARFRPLFRIFILLFTFSVVVLGYAGSQPADKVYWSTCVGDAHACEALAHHDVNAHIEEGKEPMVLKFDNTMLAQAFTGFYFMFFLIILPLLSRFEKARALPASIHEAVLAKKH
ncbi:MAG: hypothetical protein ACRBDI_02570 [Alphaproteobacteria bacterium]